MKSYRIGTIKSAQINIITTHTICLTIYMLSFDKFIEIFIVSNPHCKFAFGNVKPFA